MQSFMYSSHFSPSFPSGETSLTSQGTMNNAIVYVLVAFLTVFPSGETSLTSQGTMSNAIVYVLVAFLTVFSIRRDFSYITANYE